MWPDRVSYPGPLTYESGALPIALRGPARLRWSDGFHSFHEWVGMGRNPGRFGPIPVRSGRFGPGRLGPISGVSRFGPTGAGRFGPISKEGRFGPI